MAESAEATMIINRRIKPGREEDYADWVGRVLESMKNFPGYLGVSIVVPEGDPNGRLVLNRFEDKISMENWKNSPELKKFLSELDDYAAQTYTEASGLETWFKPPDSRSIIPPPKWKMFLVTSAASSLISFVSRLILEPYTRTWPLLVTAPFYVVILVFFLTYFAMPNVSRLLRRWLYPTSR
jgi:antibiotic biosynthesis monooxygenase (ABM) superfamily enzyme